MYYFGSGPATMPEEVLKEISEHVVRHKDELSVLEIGHRRKRFKEMVQESEQLVKELLEIGDDYEICWMHGGGRAQFAIIPMNYLDSTRTVGIIDSGHWSEMAAEYASFYGKVNILSSSKDKGYHELPKIPTIPDDLAYVYMTTNNTLYGTQFKQFPTIKVPLVVDMTSELFSRRLNYRQFDLIFAAAQKNVGPAGVALVIIKKDFLAKQRNNLPGFFSFKDLFAAHSALNTPPVFAIFASLVYLRWTCRMGMDVLEKRNQEKAEMLYQYIDQSQFYFGTAKKEDRSLMNVCFKLRDNKLEEAFLDFAKREEVFGIKGHRSVGGFRVGLYNAIGPEDVSYLIKVMKQFESQTRG